MLSNYPQLRYCKIKRGMKAPFEKDWTNKPYEWKDIQEHVRQEQNYGVLCGYGNLAVIDADNVELQKHIEAVLPATFKVKTGGGGTHNYFFVPNFEKKIVLTTDLGGKDIHWGEIQSKGTQVVAPGSIHPNGNKYEVIAPLLIIELTQEQLLSAVRPFMKEALQSQRMAEWEKERYGQKTNEIDSLNVSDIWGTTGLKAHGSEYYGSHPIHGSESGMNFWLNPSKNLWHCFRCNSGGGVLSAIAVKEGLIDCSEAQRGLLRGVSAFASIKIAKEKYGLRTTPQFNDALKESLIAKKDFELLWENELDNYEEEDRGWIIDRLVPSCSVGVWTGKRGTFKTFLVLNAIFSIASGKPFLGRFTTRKGKVIYLDKENGIYIMRQRKNMIKQGLLIKDAMPIGFICFSTLKIDRFNDMQELEKIIKEHQPELLVVDTYRRGISFEENDAGQVSRLFVDVLRPLVEKYKISIILIHHDRKGESQGDEMDMIRGSSDLANYSDFILKNERKGESIILKQLKMRSAPECNPIEIEIDTDEENFISFKSLGDYEQQTREQRCVELLTLWIIKNNLKEFLTGEAKEIAFKEGVKKNNFFNGLQILINNGLIQKESHGKYKIISKDGRLFV